MKNLALAYSMKRKAKKMAEGGQITDNYQSSCNAHCVQPCEVHQQDEYMSEEWNKKRAMKPDSAAMSEDDRKLGQHGEHEEGPQGVRMARGGSIAADEDYSRIRGVHKSAVPFSERDKGVSWAGSANERARDPSRHEYPREQSRKAARAEHAIVLSEMKKMPKPKLYSEGGQIEDGYQDSEPPSDMVGRILAQRQKMYSEGGRVANEHQGLSAHDMDHMADDDSNEMDYLALDDSLEQHDTGANSGDELSDEGEDERRADMVSRIMRSRAKKDKLPRPA